MVRRDEARSQLSDWRRHEPTQRACSVRGIDQLRNPNGRTIARPRDRDVLACRVHRDLLNQGCKDNASWLTENAAVPAWQLATPKSRGQVIVGAMTWRYEAAVKSRHAHRTRYYCGSRGCSLLMGVSLASGDVCSQCPKVLGDAASDAASLSPIDPVGGCRMSTVVSIPRTL